VRILYIASERRLNMARALALLVVVLALPVIVQAETLDLDSRYAGEDVDFELHAVALGYKGVMRGGSDSVPTNGQYI
jgi:hypothetical protein